MASPYDDIDFSPYGVGNTLREAGQDAANFGRTVKQIGTGVVGAVGATATGMQNAAAPYFEKEFGEMEAQGKRFHQGVSDFKRGLYGTDPAAAPTPAATPAKAPEPISRADEAIAASKRMHNGGLEGPMPERPTVSTVTPRGVSVTNTYDPDRPASMAAEGNNPWQDMARQLANFSALRNRDQPTPGFNALADPNEAANDEKTRRWAMEDMMHAVNRADPGKAGLIKDIAMGYMASDTQRRGQDISQNTALSGQGVQARGHDISMKSHLDGIDRSGANAQAVAGIQGRNQMENTRLQGSITGRNQEQHDLRTSVNQENLESMKQNDPRNQALTQYYTSGANERNTRTKLLEEDSALGKTPHGMAMKEIQALTKVAEQGGPAGESAQKRIMLLTAKMNLADKRNGYADGGRVETAEQLIARINANYGVSGNTPAPAPQRPTAPQQQQQASAQPASGIDRIRAYGSGAGIAQQMRANGLAEGGPVDVGGRQVLGEGTGKSDSLPAIIDGEHPAALSTDEFVMPVETVRHFGLARLHKMVEQSRKGLDAGR